MYTQLRCEEHRTVQPGIMVPFMGAVGGAGTQSIALNVASALLSA